MKQTIEGAIESIEQLRAIMRPSQREPVFRLDPPGPGDIEFFSDELGDDEQYYLLDDVPLPQDDDDELEDEWAAIESERW